jgi:hypothetical protein
MQKVFLKMKISGWSLAVLLLLATLSSCEKDKDGSPEVAAGDMSSGSIDPGEAGGGQLVTLTGSGIGQIRSIVWPHSSQR